MIDIKKYEEFIENHPKGHFMQSTKWAAVKDNWKNEIIVSEDNNGNIQGSMSLLIRKMPGVNSTIMYCPRGPVFDKEKTEVFADLFSKAKVLAKKHKSYVLKMDPDILASDEQYVALMKKFGFKLKNKSKNFEGVQPRFVFRLNVEGKTEDELMQSFHSKTRYNIRLSTRKGVTSRLGNRGDLKRFHEIMVETGARDQFVIRNLEYFEKMYDCLGDNIRLYLAEYEGNIVSGTLAIYFGDKVWYLYGASSNESRNVMPNYLLQLEMIKWSLEKGCKIYDFRGVPGDLDENNPMFGLVKFKRGFNGDFTEFIGELDYVFKPLTYLFMEKGQKVFKEVRRIIRTRK